MCKFLEMVQCIQYLTFNAGWQPALPAANYFDFFLQAGSLRSRRCITLISFCRPARGAPTPDNILHLSNQFRYNLSADLGKLFISSAVKICQFVIIKTEKI